MFFQTIRRPEGQLETKLAEAELRRKELQEEKVTKVMEHSGLERHGRMRSASTNRYITYFLHNLTTLHSGLIRSELGKKSSLSKK